jgi:hypothetical protein
VAVSGNYPFIYLALILSILVYLLCTIYGGSILWLGGGTLGSFIILNLIREALIYVLFGKSFDFKWLTSPEDIILNIIKPK